MGHDLSGNQINSQYRPIIGYYSVRFLFHGGQSPHHNALDLGLPRAFLLLFLFLRTDNPASSDGRKIRSRLSRSDGVPSRMVRRSSNSSLLPMFEFFDTIICASREAIPGNHHFRRRLRHRPADYVTSRLRLVARKLVSCHASVVLLC